MPVPTKAELFTMLSNCIKIYDQTYKFGKTNSPNYLGLEDELFKSMEGVQSPEVMREVQKVRSKLSEAVAGGKQAIFPILKKIAQIGYGSPARTEEEVFTDIIAGMSAATETIKSRDFTRGSVTAGGSNVSTGTILRCLQDEKGKALETSAVGVNKFLVVADKNSGAEQGADELLAFGSGNDPYVDLIDIGDATGEQKSFFMKRATAAQNHSLLLDPSFSGIQTTINSLNQASGWTLSVADNTKIVKDTTVFHRNDLGLESGASLKFTDNAHVAQYFQRNRIRATNKPTTSYFLVVHWMRKSSADGTLTLTLGSQSVTVDVTTGTNDVWNRLVLGDGATNKGYLSVFNEDWNLSGTTIDLGVQVKIALSSNTTGDVHIDDVILCPGEQFNGINYACIAGQSDALKADYWTFTDTSSETGRNQFILAKLFGRSLPHTTGSPTYADA